MACWKMREENNSGSREEGDLVISLELVSRWSEDRVGSIDAERGLHSLLR